MLGAPTQTEKVSIEKILSAQPVETVAFIQPQPFVPGKKVQGFAWLSAVYKLELELHVIVLPAGTLYSVKAAPLEHTKVGPET